VVLTPNDVRALRLRSLLLLGAPDPPTTVSGVARWFGALQGQDMSSLEWSLGVRLPGTTAAGIATALEDRSVVRTWPMRGTLHLVPSRDARWMVRILGERPLANAARRRAMIGLEERVAERAVEVLQDALAGGRRLTRPRCMATLAEKGIDVGSQRGYHVLWFASQRGVTAIAPTVGKDQTFVLLDEWAPEHADPARDEALGVIALRYFRSHGPATRGDFGRWTGLTAADARTAIDVVADALVRVETEIGEMIGPADLLDVRPVDLAAESHAVLPGFDEFMLGYQDRSVSLDPGHLDEVLPGGNGVFRSTLVRNGRVIGTWSRTLRPRIVAVEARPWSAASRPERVSFERAFSSYGAFLGREATVSWVEAGAQGSRSSRVARRLVPQ
jgi:hypothetical protein